MSNLILCSLGVPGDSYGYPGAPGNKGLPGDSGYPGKTPHAWLWETNHYGSPERQKTIWGFSL